MTAARPVFYVSDGTGITAETIGHSVLTQFTDTQFESRRISFVDTPERARETVERIREAGDHYGVRPIVINSCVDAEISALLVESGALMLDVFAPFIEPLERELGQTRQRHMGRAHGIVNFEAYHRRIEAINFTLTHDDGQSLDYSAADLVLVAVSRAGKTPTCIYLSHRGVKAANVPLVPGRDPPEQLVNARRPLVVGLTLSPDRLIMIRRNRLTNLKESRATEYVDLEAVREETTKARRLFERRGWATVDVTRRSVEETAAAVLNLLNQRAKEPA